MQNPVASTAHVPAQHTSTILGYGAALPPLRPATTSDLTAVERLLTDAGVPTTGVTDDLRTRPEDFVVADDPREPGELAAVAGLAARRGNAQLRWVAVRTAWRRHGLGTALVHRAVCEAEGRGLNARYLLAMATDHYLSRLGVRRLQHGIVPEALAASLEPGCACRDSVGAIGKPATGARTRPAQARAAG